MLKLHGTFKDGLALRCMCALLCGNRSARTGPEKELAALECRIIFAPFGIVFPVLSLDRVPKFYQLKSMPN